MTNTINSKNQNFFAELKKFANKKDIADVSNSKLLVNFCEEITGKGYNHQLEITTYISKIHNFFVLNSNANTKYEVMQIMDKTAYEIMKEYVQFLQYGLSFTNNRWHFIQARDWKSENKLPMVMLTSYGMRAAVSNMSNVESISDGVLVRQSHECFYEPAKQEIHHKIDMSLQKDDDSVIAVYCIIRFTDGRKEIVFIDKKALNLSYQEAQKHKKGETLNNRTKWADTYTQRLPFIRLMKIYYDPSKIKGFEIGDGKEELSSIERDAEEAGLMLKRSFGRGGIIGYSHGETITRSAIAGDTLGVNRDNNNQDTEEEMVQAVSHEADITDEEKYPGEQELKDTYNKQADKDTKQTSPNLKVDKSK